MSLKYFIVCFDLIQFNFSLYFPLYPLAEPFMPYSHPLHIMAGIVYTIL